ncbi:MAG: LPS export ABC transporter ATP-binding protein [Deltaproteobacteria bacterium]|nr:LPS export ABC transporter ATP-binding protein [Deltaproteobacteria bacterium]
MSYIAARGLCKSFGGRRVVNDVGFAVKGGEVVGLLGPNGAGKTTSFYMVVGLMKPDAGQVFLGDRDITQEPMYKRARQGITYLPQEPSVFRKLSVEDNIKAILETLPIKTSERKRRLEMLLEELDLTPLRRNMAFSLSGGERRRLEITRALVISPRFMLLDEPFAGIDPLAVADIKRIIAQLKSRGIGVLISDHNVRDTLKVCDKAYIIADGKIVEEGEPERIASSPKAREIYLGHDFTL